MNKLRHSMYLCTPSGSVCPFCTIFLKPQKRAVSYTHLTEKINAALKDLDTDAQRELMSEMVAIAPMEAE